MRLLKDESRELPSMLASLDYKYWEWKNCPIAYI